MGMRVLVVPILENKESRSLRRGSLSLLSTIRDGFCLRGGERSTYDTKPSQIEVAHSMEQMPYIEHGHSVGSDHEIRSLRFDNHRNRNPANQCGVKSPAKQPKTSRMIYAP